MAFSMDLVLVGGWVKLRLLDGLSTPLGVGGLRTARGAERGEGRGSVVGGHVEGQPEGVLLQLVPRAEPGTVQAVAAPLVVGTSPAGSVVVHELGDRVEGRPAGVADGGDFLTLAPLEQVVEGVPDVPGPAVAAVGGVGIEGLEVAAELGGGGLVTGQEVEPDLQVVVVAAGQPEDFLGLTDLGGEVALVADRDPFALAAPVGHRQCVRTDARGWG